MTHFELSFRTPESTSVARLMAFNETQVSYFFDLLRQLLLQYKFEASQIFNIDETGVTTVPKKAPKVISPTGMRRVSKVSSAERGELVTIVGGISATGVYVPPLFIFPRQRVQDHYKTGAPAGSCFLGNSSGWMTKETFLKYLEHFEKHARPSENHPVLLIMDNHASHTSLESINYCREHHIVLLGIPPHTSGRLQPLDVGVFGPLKRKFETVCDNYLIANPGKVIRIENIASLFNTAYKLVAKVETAIKAFEATGIQPFNPNVFGEDDFEASLTTERNSQTVPSTQHRTPLQAVPNVTPVDASAITRTTRTPEIDPEETEPLAEPLPVSEPIPSTSFQSALPPLPPVQRPETKKPRKKLPSLHLSRKKQRDEKEEKQKQRLKK